MTCLTITLAPSTLPNGTAGTAYSQTLTASGGTPPYTHAVTTGSLPTGLTLSTSGALTGSPTAVGTFAFTVTATDAHSCTGGRTYSVTMLCPAITLAPVGLPGGTLGTTYGQTITATGGTPSYTYAVTAGDLPAGLSLSTGGLLSGAPTTADTYSFTVAAMDAYGCIGSRSYSITMTCPTITLSPASLSAGAPGTAYSQTITASGGAPSYTYAVTSGSLPGGLLLSSSGVLSGTPTASGTFNFTISATDAYGCTGSRAYSLVVVNPPVISLIKKASPPFKLVVTGSNLQNGIKVYINGAQWGSVIWKNTGKIQLTGAIKTAVPKGTTKTFRFVNPDAGEATMNWGW